MLSLCSIVLSKILQSATFKYIEYLFSKCEHLLFACLDILSGDNNQRLFSEQHSCCGNDNQYAIENIVFTRRFSGHDLNDNISLTTSLKYEISVIDYCIDMSYYREYNFIFYMSCHNGMYYHVSVDKHGMMILDVALVICNCIVISENNSYNDYLLIYAIKQDNTHFKN